MTFLMESSHHAWYMGTPGCCSTPASEFLKGSLSVGPAPMGSRIQESIVIPMQLQSGCTDKRESSARATN